MSGLTTDEEDIAIASKGEGENNQLANDEAIVISDDDPFRPLQTSKMLAASTRRGSSS
jgi:hypothetical protein